MKYKCNIASCEYNTENECFYCGDYWELSSKNCIAFVSKYDDIEEPMTQEELDSKGVY